MPRQPLSVSIWGHSMKPQQPRQVAPVMHGGVCLYQGTEHPFSLDWETVTMADAKITEA